MIGSERSMQPHSGQLRDIKEEATEIPYGPARPPPADVLVVVATTGGEAPRRTVETMTAAVLVQHPEVRGDDCVFQPRPIIRREKTAEPPNLAEARGAVNAGDHHVIAELGDADRGLAVEAAVPTEPIRLVAGGPLNALGVFFDRGEQVVVAATGKRGGGQWHRGSPDDSPSTYGDRRHAAPSVPVQAREPASAEGVGSPSGGRPSRGHGRARSRAIMWRNSSG